MKGEIIFLISVHLLYFCFCKVIEKSINIDVLNPIAIVNSNFLSVGLGAHSIEEKFMKHGILNSKKFLTIAKGLQGNSLQAYVYFRIGGSYADNITYNLTNFVLNVKEFSEILSFCYDVRWKLVFDLNSLTRNPDGSWNSRNAEELIDYSFENGYYVDYELGNEPDLYPTHRNISISSEQLAKDFKKLKNVLNVKTRHQSKLYGPDMATLTRYDYFQKFLSAVDRDVLDAVTYHHYYSSSENITVNNFTNVEYLDEFLFYMQKAKTIIDSSLVDAYKTPVWLGETSITYGGGAPIGMSFIAGFLWLDKLGLAAQMNISVVIRQSITGGKYSLTDRDINPAPDYWISVLYKRLVGQTVLNTTGFLQPGRYVRVYAHCVYSNGAFGYHKGQIVLLILNLNQKEKAIINFADSSLQGLEIDQYLFSPLDGNLDDFHVRLNGVPLKMINDTTLPDLQPIQIKQPIDVPPLQYGYFVLVGSYAKACFNI